MAPLRAFAINWNVASDDFVFAGFTGFTIHLVGTILLAIGYSYYQKIFATCPCCTILQLFLIGMLSITALLAIADFGIGWISCQGSISRPGPRRYLPYWLYFRCLLTVPEVTWLSLGTYWAFYSNSSPCLQLEHDLLKIAVIMEWCLIAIIILVLPCTLCPPARFNHDKLSGDRARRSWKRLLRCLFCYRNWDNYNDSGPNRRFLCCLPLLILSCLPRCYQAKSSRDGVYAAISELLSSIFHDMNTVPSDIAAGLTLVKRQQKKDQLRYEIQTATIIRNNRNALSKIDYKDSNNWQVLNNLCYYYEYTTAIYGWPFYLLKNSICCHGAICSLCRSCCHERLPSQETVMIGDNACHCHQTAIKGLIQRDLYEIVYVSYQNELYETPFLLAVDRSHRSVVISIRGTMSLTDLAADMIATPAKLLIDGIRDAYAHQGITKCAESVKCKLEENDLLAMIMKQHSSYRLVITGHSLGAGTAAILAILLRKDYPELACYAYSPPGGLLSPSLRTYTEDFIISMVLGNDIVPRLSTQNLRKLRHEILTQLKNCLLPKYKVLSTGKCCCCCCCAQFTLGCMLNCTDADIENGQPSIDPYLSQDENIVDLFLPGKIVHLIAKGQLEHSKIDRLQLFCSSNLELNQLIVRVVVSSTSEDVRYTAYWCDHLVFDKILITGSMIPDHLPIPVGKALNDISNLLSQNQIKLVTTV